LLAQAGTHPCSVPARAGFPHARPRPPQAKPQGLSRTVACFTPPAWLRPTAAPTADTPVTYAIDPTRRCRWRSRQVLNAADTPPTGPRSSAKERWLTFM